MSDTTLRIAVLVCDLPIQAVCDNYGDYATQFNNLFLKAGELYSTTHKPITVETIPFDVTKQQYPADPAEFKYYVMTGSKSSAYDTDPWIAELIEFVRHLDTLTDVKVLGVCFGHQIIAQALGGEVVKNPRGWEVGWTAVNFLPKAHEILKPGRDILRIQEMHQDHVKTVPPGFEVFAETSICPIQGMVKGKKYLTIQSHPEFSGGVVSEIIKARKILGVWGPDNADRYLSTVFDEIDGIWFGSKMIGFLLDDMPEH